MRIVELKPYPVSVPVPPEHQVSLGIGRMIKRDAVVVKVVLASIENGGYFEEDVSKYNPLRDQLVSTQFEISADGCVQPLDKPGLGLEADEDFLAKHPVIDGVGYI